VLKVQDACKEAVDKYFENISQIDKMNIPKEVRNGMKTRMTKSAVNEPGWKDKAAEIVINSYISGIGTPAVNLLSALVKAPLLVAERALVGMYPKSDVKAMESFSMVKGFFEGMAEGLSFAKQGGIEGMPLDIRVNTDVMAGFGRGSAAGPIERGFAPVVTAPTRAGVFVDEYAKAVFRRMQLNALAYRVSRTVPEKKLGGLTRDEMYTKLRSVDISDPTKVGNTRVWREELAKVSPDLVDDLTNFARIQTFQGDLGTIGNAMLKARAEHPELVLIAPFIKTPINILKDALSYTPAAALSKSLRKDLQLTNEQAAARILLGSGLAYMTAQAVFNGNLTGSYPKDAGLREAMIAANIPEYSVKIGDRWYSYSRVEPLASVLGIVADSAESIVDYSKLPKQEQEAQKLATDAVAAVTKNLASKTFLEGISGLMQAIHDPERYGGSFINSFAGLLVPAAVAQFARGVDPVQRDVDSFVSALQNRIPGLREDLPVRFDITGKPRANPSYGLAGSVGIASRDAEQNRLQQEFQNIGFSYKAPSRSLRGVELDQTDYEQYSKMSGDLVNRILTPLVESPTYQALPPARRKFVLEKRASDAREAATKMMLGKKLRDPEFYKEYVRVQKGKKGIE
jgi:hypothetical protein